MNQKTNYGNWVPEKMLTLCYVGAAVFGIAAGITEVHYIGNLEKKLDFIPGYATTPWMISGMGILYGRK